MCKVFISHSSQDDAFVRELRAALELHEQDGWIDSRELRGGDPLWSEIQQVIEDASAYAIIVSPDALQSDWVGDELAYALEVQQNCGKDDYPVIPLLLDGTKLGVLKRLFGEQPLYIPVSSDAGGIDAAMNAILVALRKRDPADVPAAPQPRAEPLEELVLELSDLKFHEDGGVRRASALAELVYEPAPAGKEKVTSENSWRLVAPVGPIELEEIRWYLEKYAVWPSKYFDDRAKKVEQSLKQWGRDLYNAAFPPDHVANVREAWAAIPAESRRRFSVFVKSKVEAGASEERINAAREVATLLLGLPWELLHDGKGFLFQGAKPTRVRRRLPRTESFDVPVVAPPIRVLLVTARPEDEACLYLDHRASALPLVQAMENLGSKVQIHVLGEPTLSGLRDELDRARLARQSYHVVHFDGHGVYDRRAGLGGLCFEDSQDIGKLDGRRHQTVYTDQLGPLLRDHRIPLVFLEACQTAMSEEGSESVASELLNRGVASVVAMSHSVLVETASRFVHAFYAALAEGRRVGDAMLAGQRRLADDTFRGRIFGAGELHLQDWFVPVLFQEKDDPQLFTAVPAGQTVEDFQTALGRRLGELPPPPDTGFIGRSRELLALQRLLRDARYAVIRGQGGEGKTALAAELARWLVRSQQVRRAAFVSVELHSDLPAVLDAIGRQLVPNYSVATFDDGEQAVLAVERALREQRVLLVVDNMESILLPAFGRDETPEALSEEAGREVEAILALCQRLNRVGQTRIVFTSREALPAPFDAPRNRRELHRLDREDAVKLVERALNADLDQPPAASAARLMSDTRQEQIEQLVDAVHCHARTLALLAPALRKYGVERTRESLVELMAEMERRFPGSREQSVYASVELSLRRMSPENRQRAQVLAVFHGGVDLDMLSVMMEWETADVASLAAELIETGLATPNRYNHLTLNPALCPYLHQRIRVEARGASEGDAARGADRPDPSVALRPSIGAVDALTARWVAAMRGYARFLVQQSNQNAELAATLTMLELPNLFALLDHVQAAGDAAATIDLATTLYSLLENAGRPRLLERVGQVRDAAAAALGQESSHARFEAERTRIEQQEAGGRLREALVGAQQLLDAARATGEQAYDGADYNLAIACFLLARVLNTAGGSQQALPLLDEGRQRFEAIAEASNNKTAERMASACITEQGECLLNIGRLDEAGAAYEETISRAEKLGDERQVAVGKGQLGTLRYVQRRYPEALAAYSVARERFTRLNEPATVAVFWHQTGMVYQDAGQPEAAEDAYRKSLAIKVRLSDVAGQASTLGQLGNLYGDVLDRPEEAAALYRQAADNYVGTGDTAKEGRVRNNLANTFCKLGRLDEARQEIRRAIKCDEPFGHAAQPWKTWAILADIETQSGNSTAAARAKQQAIDLYLAYRRDGGENHNTDGRIALAVTQAFVVGASSRSAEAPSQINEQRLEAPATEMLNELAANPNLHPLLRPFIAALQQIAAGSRDRTLAAAPELHFSSAAEILLLIETLDQPR